MAIHKGLLEDGNIQKFLADSEELMCLNVGRTSAPRCPWRLEDQFPA